MSTQTVIEHLEKCAEMLLAPPDCITYEDRNRAQMVFLDFQKTKCPFDLCRSILESSSVAFVQFQSGCCLKNGVIRDWVSLSPDERKFLLQYLNEYVNREQIESYVREVLLLVCAIILKRIAIDEGNDSATLASILTYLFETMANASAQMHVRIVACASVSSLLNEYSSSTRASDFGLPWATHLRAKKKFENTHLKSIFRCVVESLVAHMRLPEESRTNNWVMFAQRLLQICDFILSWNFDIITIFSSQYAKHVDSTENPILQPAIDWKEIILDADVITVFFEMHLYVRTINDEKMIHHSLQCLSQLSSLNGTIILNNENRLKFINTIMNGTIRLVNNIIDTLTPNEVTPLTAIINRICVRLQCRDQITYIQTDILKSFFEVMARVCCKLIFDSLNYQNDEQFDHYKLSIDNILNSWTVLICTIDRVCEGSRDDVDSGPNISRNKEMIKVESLVAYARPIFEAYVRVHLNQPEGLRKLSSAPEEDIKEFEDDDIVIFYDQLNSIGCLARIDASHSINCLTQLLSLRINQLQMCLQRDDNSPEKMIEWTNLNEDIHWLLLISTAVLTQANMSERELIPSQIMTLSIDSRADLSQTLVALQNCDPSNASIDPVVRIIILLFKLCSMEKLLCESRMTHWISPQVALSLTLFTTRFSLAYLLPCESDYNEMSMALNSCFGRDSHYANQTLNFIIDHIIAKLINWPSESQVTDESSLTLVQFVRNCSERCKALNNCVEMNKLLEKHTKNELQNISIVTRKNIYQVFVYIATYKKELYDRIFLPLRERYRHIQMQLENGHNTEQIRAAVIELCECLEGISNGITANNVSIVWSNVLSPVFNDLGKLLMVFHNYNSVVIAILQLHAQLANRALCFLTDSETLSFYNSSIEILNQYAKYNAGKLSREDTEEEVYNDISIILNFLNDLASKDFIEWFPPAPESEGSSITATQVVFIGLNIIMPLMSQQLLDFPKLRQSYYKLIVFLCEDADRLQVLPDQLMESIMRSVQLALKSTYGNEIKSNCLTMLSILGGHGMREPNKFLTIVRLLEPFLSLIFEFTLMECGSSNDVTIRESVANALFSLICCFPSKYEELVQQLIAQQKDSNTQFLLRSSFEKLMNGLTLDASRVHRATFKRRFETFVIEVQGLLCIK